MLVLLSLFCTAGSNPGVRHLCEDPQLCSARPGLCLGAPTEGCTPFALLNTNAGFSRKPRVWRLIPTPQNTSPETQLANVWPGGLYGHKYLGLSQVHAQCPDAFSFTLLMSPTPLFPPSPPHLLLRLPAMHMDCTVDPSPPSALPLLLLPPTSPHPLPSRVKTSLDPWFPLGFVMSYPSPA